MLLIPAGVARFGDVCPDTDIRYAQEKSVTVTLADQVEGKFVTREKTIIRYLSEKINLF